MVRESIGEVFINLCFNLKYELFSKILYMEKKENSIHSNPSATLKLAHRKKTRKVLSSLLNNRGISHRRMANFDESMSNLQDNSGDLTTGRLRNDGAGMGEMGGKKMS